MFRRISCGFLILIFIVSALTPFVMAAAIASLPSFSRNDRVLIVAPHPDDETIGAGGVIQAALHVGARVRVLIMTNGENNQPAFIVYKKRPVLFPKEILKMGELRRQESVAALMSLGVNQKDIEVLGYPDHGLMDIFSKYWGPVKKPFRSMFSRKRNVPFQSARSYGAPYVGESILKDVKSVLMEFKPNKIFVSHPADVNRDHKATYLFFQLALWDLADHLPAFEVLPYIVHIVGWPKPRGYFPDKAMYVSDDLLYSDIVWRSLDLDPALVQKKNEAIAFYDSQNRASPKYLPTFARRNELFGTFPQIALERQSAEEVLWQEVGSGVIREGVLKAGFSDQISSLGFARSGDDLLVRVRLKRLIEKDFSLYLSLFGYRFDVPFAKMPKLVLSLGLDGIQVKDKRATISSKGIQHSQAGNDILLSIPLSFLKGPDRIMASVKTSFFDLTYDETAWRELLIK